MQSEKAFNTIPGCIALTRLTRPVSLANPFKLSRSKISLTGSKNNSLN